MKLPLAVLIFMGVVLVFSSAATDDDKNTSTPQGTYKNVNLFFKNLIMCFLKI